MLSTWQTKTLKSSVNRLEQALTRHSSCYSQTTVRRVDQEAKLAGIHSLKFERNNQTAFGSSVWLGEQRVIWLLHLIHYLGYIWSPLSTLCLHVSICSSVCLAEVVLQVAECIFMNSAVFVNSAFASRDLCFPIIAVNHTMA